MNLVSITFYPSEFDENYGVEWVLLDISKAFDKVWHEEDLHGTSMQRDIRKVVKSSEILKNIKQIIFLIGSSSSWISCSKCTIRLFIRLTFNLICINNLSDNHQCNPKLFADNPSCFLPLTYLIRQLTIIWIKK